MRRTSERQARGILRPERAVSATARHLARDTIDVDTLLVLQQASGNALVARMLAPSVPVMQRESPLAALPPQIELRDLEASFTLPAGKSISSNVKRELRTASATTVTVSMTHATLSVVFRPSVLIDVQYPGQNMLLGSVTYFFETGDVRSSVDVVEGWGEGFIDFTGTARGELADLVTSALAGTPAGTKGYNPVEDPDPMGTVRAVRESFNRLPSTGTSDVSVADIGDVSAGVSLATRDAFHYETGGGLAVDIHAGAPLLLSVEGGGTAADLSAAAEEGPQAVANAAKVQAVTVRPHGLVISKDGEPVVSIEEIRLERGGKVTVPHFTPMGKIEEAAKTEGTLVGVLTTLFIAAQGVPPDAAAQLAYQGGHFEPKVVPGIARAQIEQGVSAALLKLIADHAGDIPGVDLSEALGMKVRQAPVPAPAPAPAP